jgi:hypothetical protein
MHEIHDTIQSSQDGSFVICYTTAIEISIDTAHFERIDNPLALLVISSDNII